MENGDPLIETLLYLDDDQIEKFLISDTGFSGTKEVLTKDEFWKLRTERLIGRSLSNRDVN